jgi:tetratricopeptide (TPR) repeat protein
MRPDHATALYASARLRWGRGDAAGALDRLALLRAAEPGGGRGLLLAAEIHADPRSGPLRDPARAADLAARAVDLNPEESGTHLGLGRALLAAGRLSEAGERLAVAARMNPRDAESRSLLGVLDLRAGDRERAGARFREALRCASGKGVGGAACGPPGEGDTLADLDPGRAPGPGELRALAALHLLGAPLRGAKEGDPPPGARERCGEALRSRGTGEALIDLDGDGKVDAAALGPEGGFAAAILAPGGGVLLLRQVP